MRLNKKIRTIFTVFASALLLFLYGYATSRFKLFPASFIEGQLRPIVRFLRAHSEEVPISIAKKFEHDRGGIPWRHARPHLIPLPEIENSSDFLIGDVGLQINGRTSPLLPDGFVLVNGFFNFDEAYNEGMVLLSTKGDYIKRWNGRQDVNMNIDFRKARILGGHGVVSWCDSLPNEFALSLTGRHRIHHGMAVAPDGTYWTHRGGRERALTISAAATFSAANSSAFTYKKGAGRLVIFPPVPR